MSKLALIIPFFISTISYCQELSISSKVGIARGETVDLKKIMFYSSVVGGIEFVSKKNIAFKAEIGVEQVSYDSYLWSAASIFNRKNFVTIPISIKKYYPLSKKSSGFWQFGTYASYLHRSTKEKVNMFAVSREIEKNLGANIGVSCLFGFKTALTPSIKFDIAIGGQQDYVFIYKNISDKTKLRKTYMQFAFSKTL